MCGAEVLDRHAAAWRVLDGVPDPEVPALSVRDLGIVREVRDDTANPGGLEVVLTPTYSGCPATEVISDSVREAVEAAGLGPVRVSLQRAPAWTTDWISQDGRRKLREYGIAPPGPVREDGAVAIRLVPRAARGAGGSGAPIAPFGPAAAAVECPRCSSPRTERLSAFGSTACKALYRCLACREPFEHFKPI
ncbi:MAG: 1,2-phenylacetyl-CoA epoxidase subunit PaaD [Rubrivivax sp.]